MDVLTTGVLSFAAGVVIGAGLLFWLLPARRQAGQLIRDREDAVKELNNYREQVDEHFLHTADLVNNLTQSYHAVHEQLSKGAKQLCSEAGHKRAAAKSLDALPPSEDSEEITPPLDYAPSAQGTLAENFGLDREKQEDESSTDTPVEPPRDYAEGFEDEVPDETEKAKPNA